MFRNIKISLPLFLVFAAVAVLISLGLLVFSIANSSSRITVSQFPQAFSTPTLPLPTPTRILIIPTALPMGDSVVATPSVANQEMLAVAPTLVPFVPTNATVEPTATAQNTPTPIAPTQEIVATPLPVPTVFDALPSVEVDGLETLVNAQFKVKLETISPQVAHSTDFQDGNFDWHFKLVSIGNNFAPEPNYKLRPGSYGPITLKPFSLGTTNNTTSSPLQPNLGFGDCLNGCNIIIQRYGLKITEFKIVGNLQVASYYRLTVTKTN